MKTCLKCGAQYSDEALFCSNCGFKDIQFCPECGKPRIPGSLFCAGCGIRYYNPEGQAAAPAAPAAPVQAPAAEPEISLEETAPVSSQNIPVTEVVPQPAAQPVSQIEPAPVAAPVDTPAVSSVGVRPGYQATDMQASQIQPSSVMSTTESQLSSVYQAAAPAAPVAPMAAPAAPAAPAKKKFPLIPVIIGGVALVVAAGVAVFFIATTPSRKYKQAEKSFEAGDYANAAAQFEAAGNYEDAAERAEEAKTIMHYESGKQAFDAEEFDKAKEEFEAAGKYKDAADRAAESETAGHYAKGVSLSSSDPDAAIAEFIQCVDYKDTKDKLYDLYVSQGDKALTENAFDKAADYYKKAGEFKDVSEKLAEVIYEQGTKAAADKNYEKAIEYFKVAGNYKDSAEQIQKCYYEMGDAASAANDLLKATNYYAQAGNYKDAASKAQAAYYTLGVDALNNKDYDKAAEYLKLAGNYKDAASKAQEAYYNKGVAALNNNDYATAAEYLALAGNYKDAKTLLGSTAYTQGIQALIDGKFAEAKKLFEACGNYKYAAALVNVCDAELAYKNGKFSDAVSAYSKVNKKVKVSGFDIAGRKAIVSARVNLEKAKGNYEVKSNSIYVQNTKITRISRRLRLRQRRKWYFKTIAAGQGMYFTYTVNADGTFNIKGQVKFVKFLNYNQYQWNVKTAVQTYDIDLKNQKKFPASIKLASGTTLKFKNGQFTLQYKKKAGKTVFNSTVVYKKTT